jgi:radical SAM superfamily enzyme YgiQ (UPF0313 family)
MGETTISETNAMNLRSPGSILLISCYELGHQPFAAAMPLAFLERAGFAPEAMDIAVENFEAEKVARARFIAISVPMHTALRLGMRVVEHIRETNPSAIICLYGLYAALNADYLLTHGVDYCIGGEFETSLVNLVEAIDKSQISNLKSQISNLKRLPFIVPSRRALPPLARYARLEHNGERRVVGYVEASRGCLHLCTHCPIPPVYGGRFFVIPPEIVLEDVRQQVRAGATHITFGDPDFLNGPKHSLGVLRAMRAEFPHLTFDFTAKVEHILERRAMFPEFAALGCLFVISAVESLSDVVLDILKKDHTRAGVEEALRIVHGAGIALRPTWVAFSPWTTLDDYLEIFEFVETHGLIDHVDPVQYSIRLLAPPGSDLIDHPAMQPHLEQLEQASFYYRWTHPDPRMDRLHEAVSALVEADAQAGGDPADTFYRIWALAADVRGASALSFRVLPRDRLRAPRLSEPWFC